jgi:hypothetical protein
VQKHLLPKWRWMVRVRPFALHWLEEHAMAVERKRIAKADAGEVGDDALFASRKRDRELDC